jgi:hypothetical protein
MGIYRLVWRHTNSDWRDVESDSETSIREVLNLLEAPENHLYKWNYTTEEYEEFER